MRRNVLIANFAGIAFAVCCIISVPSLAAEKVMPAAPLVFFDIAAPDLPSQAKFYSAVFGWKIGADGSFSVSVASPLPANLRVEPASQGPVIERVAYFGVEDITATLEKVVKNGGSIVFPRFVVPGRVIIGMFKDPAGNRTGLVEMKDGKVVVPPA